MYTHTHAHSYICFFFFFPADCQIVHVRILKFINIHVSHTTQELFLHLRLTTIR